MDPNWGGGGVASQEAFGNAWRYFALLSGDIFDCHNMEWGGNSVGLCWVGAKFAAQHPTMCTTALTTKPYSPHITEDEKPDTGKIEAGLGHFGRERTY